ncbi:efflux RND transporter periplasmic adaptor subunit [Myxococcota bacterium]|nr:efflux RND transporter periplasmic adaptor subunit [Myxococcota bacterium]
MNPRILVTPLLFAPLLAAACTKPSEAPPAEPTRPAEAVSSPGRWVEVKRPADHALLEVPARVVAPADASGVVAPIVRAKVAKVHVRIGQRVERGAAIVDVIIPELQHAAAVVTSADTRLAAYAERSRELSALKAEGLVRSESLFELEARRADVAAERAIALAALTSAGLDEVAAKDLVARGTVTLKSPTSGVVASLTATPGEVRDAAGAPFARILGEGVGRVEARFVAPLPPARAVVFVTTSGELVELAPKPVATTVDPDDGSRTAWFDLKAPRPLPGGLAGRLRVEAEGARLVEVPAEAIQRRDGKIFVERKTATGTEEVEVSIATESGASAIVESSLVEGDRVLALPAGRAS